MTVDRTALRLAEDPFREATDAEAWQVDVHNLMRAGFGTEDIAHKLGSPLEDVEAERDILLAEGRLDALYTGRLAEPAEAAAPMVVAPRVEPSPEERRSKLRSRIAADLAWGMKAKDQMRAKGAERARKACPRCDGIVRLELVGPKAHLRAACETPNCLRIME